MHIVVNLYATGQRALYMLAADRNVRQTSEEHLCCTCFWDTKHHVKSGGYGHETRDMNQLRNMIMNFRCVRIFLSFVNKQLDH